MVVLGHGAFTFHDLNGHGWLVVGGCAENLGLLGWDDGVSGDQLGHDATNGFNSKSKWVDVEQNEVTSVFFPAEHAGLYGSSIGNSLVGVDATRRLLKIKKFAFSF